eukprot:jgi/Botrbrau1/4842/Bobra.0032s0003.1
MSATVYCTRIKNIPCNAKVTKALLGRKGPCSVALSFTCFLRVLFHTFSPIYWIGGST